MKKMLLTVVAASAVLAGCATGSSGIVASYSSPMMYGGYSCSQLAMEDQMLKSRVAELKGAVDRSSTNDKIMTGVGVVLFWPALFFIKGNGEEQAQYAEMKGQHEAIQQAFVLKNCASAPLQQAGFGMPPGAGGPVEPPAAAPAATDGFGDGSRVVRAATRF